VLDEADASPPDDSDGETFALPPVCGDGNVDPGEECDDGNRMNDDGCDWRCRVGDGTFEYPPPESGASEVTPVAPPLAVVPDAEFTETDGRARLAWGSGAFGLAYPVDQPYLAVRFRTLDVNGATVAGPWETMVAWSQPAIALVWNGVDFALFRRRFERGALFMTRIGLSATEIFPEREIPLESLPGGTDLMLESAVWGRERYALAYSMPVSAEWDGGWVIHAVTAGGDLAGDPIRAEPWDEISGLGQIVALPDGFGVSNGVRALMLGPDLRLRGWTGSISVVGTVLWAHGQHMAVAEDRLLFCFGTARTEGDRTQYDLWEVGVGFDGDLLFPPRIIAGNIGEMDEIAVAYGAAGLLVAVSGRPSGTGGISVLNTDRWGNVLSGPTNVESEGGRALLGGIEVAADDLGYGLVFYGSGSTPEARTVLFSRYVPAP
jgi:cysteine-rich repeat protein